MADEPKSPSMFSIEPMVQIGDQCYASMPYVIGLAGHKGAGKSTLAQKFTSFTTVPLSYEVKAMVKGFLRSLGFSWKVIEEYSLPEDKEKEIPGLAELAFHSDMDRAQSGRILSMRYLWTTLGTEWGRDMVGPDIWVSQTNAAITNIRNHGGRCLIDGIRFQEEIDLIKRWNGVIIWVNDGFPHYQWVESQGHKSEKYMGPDLADYVYDGYRVQRDQGKEFDRLLSWLWRHGLSAPTVLPESVPQK